MLLRELLPILCQGSDEMQFCASASHVCWDVRRPYVGVPTLILRSLESF